MTMGSSYESIIGSSIFKFVVGPHNKEYCLHGAAISNLSKPLDVLLNGHMKEAAEKRVNWPDVDEKTFVRFAQWAYTANYVTEEPDIVLDHLSIDVLSLSRGSSDPVKIPTDRMKVAEKPLYSLVSYAPPERPKENCWNRKCNYYGRYDQFTETSVKCLACKEVYDTKACSACSAVFSDCPRCGPPTTIARVGCQNRQCGYHNRASVHTNNQTCLRCRTSNNVKACSHCYSVFSDCPHCAVNMAELTHTPRRNLIDEFLDETCTTYRISSSVSLPRPNREACEDYTGVFLCHAKLYVLGDKYDIPPLSKLALHRLHSTLKVFALYPSRMDDIATLAKYIFDNTVPEDKIRDMITLYYACIVEDALKYDGLKSLIDEIPDFAFGLISKMSERLA